MSKPKFIPYAKQWIDEEDIQAVAEVLRGEFLTTGPAVGKFGEDVARVAGTRYAVAISNGTAALHAAVAVAGIGPGDEVITSPITFAASANCALYVGATPVFADIDPQTYNIDPADVERKITSRTKAIIPVHFTGQPCDMEKLRDIANRHNLILIADGAHALGATYKDRPAGTWADMTTYSFHPVKQVATGEGGAIATDNPEFYEKLLTFRSHGITRDPAKLRHGSQPWYYEQQSLGYNYRMTDFQAALGSSQLKKLPMFLELRRKYARRYNEAFRNMPGIITPWQSPEGESAWHLYVIRLELEKLNVDRDIIFQELWDRGIGVNVHYIPVYSHAYYRDLGYPQGLCPQAEKLFEAILTIPLFPAMTDADVEQVIETVGAVVRTHLR
ncbi:MAG TPA: UDP-4-amino-4,6-dideoxy-N-acetyl-beta-L-altrosamine transaminase [Negativicutes bacterium]|nr:UDP-4-amino-4,6-dideoxy-N-acetyl-beta-L-altrosamine transaminase [Negativicutes bacterium]